ncbi:MAG: hypothetical protein GYA14_04835 [Ignavibacteria bacterium]|nr:hypothetical protein [Ignavibacteria bacterium]
MKNIFLLVLEVFLFASFSFPQSSNPSFIKIEWLSPVIISDTGFTQYSTPVMSVINTDHIIFPYIQRPFRSPDFRNNNVYIKELKNGVLTDSINLTKNIYYSNWPVIKSDRNGITHLIWGYSPVDPNTIRPIISTDLYYSYNKDNSWSNPISIFHKELINGENSYDTGKLRLDSKNRLHLLWRAIFSSGLYLYHKTEENCVWSETEALPFISADYDYIFDKNDRLHMAYLRPVIGPGSDVNSVFYRFSDDYGKTWSDSVLVHRSFTLRALNVQILIDKQNNIHILWTKHLSGSVYAAETIYHSYSTDGKNWISPNRAVLTIEDAILYFNAAIDKDDNIHLAYDQWNGLFTIPVKLCYSYWDGINWSVPIDLFNNSQMPRIEIDSLNYLHLIFATEAGGYIYYTRTTKPLITDVYEKKITYLMIMIYCKTIPIPSIQLQL